MKRDTQNIERKAIDEDEIDLIEITKAVWASRRIIYLITLAFFIVGLIVAFTSKVEYEASCKLLPDAQDSKMPGLGGLGGLAGLAGINLDFGSKGSLSPELYPEITKSMAFQMQLIKSPIRFEKLDTTISPYTFFKNYSSPTFFSILSSYTIGLPGKIKQLFSEEKKEEDEGVKKRGEIIYLSLSDKMIIEGLKSRVNVEVNNKTGIITLTAEMPDKIASAELANNTMRLLQKSVIDYKLNKSRENLKFVKERHAEAKKRFETSQEKLARFTDRNRNILSSLVLAEEQRLQTEYNLTFEVYKGLSTQLEQAEIKVKEDTPVFTVIEPIQVPIDKSKPKRKLIIAIAVSLGILIGLSTVFIKDFILPKFRQ